MSVRTLRRTFASPFVITLAAIPAACMVQSPPPRGGGQPVPTTEQQSRPQPTEGGAMRQQGAEQGREQGPTTAPTAPTTVISNPPRPGAEQVAPTTDRRWTVTRDGNKCQAFVKVSCPPNTMCNPPPPQAYACTPEIVQGSSMKIVQWAGQLTCQVEPEPMKCPAGATCNPPRPRQVSCPSD